MPSIVWRGQGIQLGIVSAARLFAWSIQRGSIGPRPSILTSALRQRKRGWHRFGGCQLWRIQLRYITRPCGLDEAVELPSGYGPYLPISTEDADSFNDAFSDELDSSFSSSIACCDNCYADFRAHWPDVTFRRDGTELMSMETHWAVDESRLSGAWSPAEYSSLRRLVQCPRCLTFDSANIYLFEHRFSDARDMEDDIDALITIGSVTPFLLLEHSFAQRVLAEVRAEGARAKVEALTQPLYRARLADDVAHLRQPPDDPATYGPAPASATSEGRFNHAGVPMLYLADAGAVAAAELGAVGQACLVGTLRIMAPLKIFDLIRADGESVDSDLFDALANSALLGAPRTGDGWIKRQYVFSRYVADCARSAGFHAIRYGSTKTQAGVNYVILDPPNDLMSLVRLEGYACTICPAPAHRY